MTTFEVYRMGLKFSSYLYWGVRFLFLLCPAYVLDVLH